MKRPNFSILICYFLMSCLSINYSFAEVPIDYKTAKTIVKSLPCSNGDTIDSYLNKKATAPAIDDLGWKAYPRKDGFEIERLMLLNSATPLSYKWHVSPSGTATPINGKAAALTPH